MKSEGVKKTAIIVFCLCILITGVSIGTGVIARNYQKNDVFPRESVRTEDEGADQVYKKEESESGQAVLSEFETKAEGEVSRNQNLLTACQKMEGVEIGPGETLSFNDTVGPYTEENGYVPGPTIIGGTQIGQELGGGVCQVSTTLYNAALLGNLGIVERHRHSFPSEYVEVGRDAMITMPESDLKIQNTTDQTIRIEASAEEGAVTIRLLGTELEPGMEVRIDSTVVNETLPEGDEVRLTTDLEAGTQQILQEARIGYETKVTRSVYKDNELVSQEVISEDIYPPVRRVILEGYKQSK